MDVNLSRGIYTSYSLVEVKKQNFVPEKLHQSFLTIKYLYLYLKLRLKINSQETFVTYSLRNSYRIQMIHRERSMEPGQCGHH